MHIAFVTTEYATDGEPSGGLANHLRRCAEALSEMGHSVEVFAPAKEAGTGPASSGPTVHSVPRPGGGRVFFSGILGGHLERSSRALHYAFLAAHAVRKRHEQRPFDVIQVASYDACGLFLCLRSPAPTIVRLSSLETLWREARGGQPTWDSRLLECLERTTIRRSAGAFAPSRFLAHKAARFGLDVEVLKPPFYLECPVERGNVESVLGADHVPPYILYVGAIAEHKGLRDLANALTTVLADVRTAHVLFVGPDRRSRNGKSLWEELAQELSPYADRVRYLGTLPHEAVYPLMDRARVVVVPSLVDNIPNVALEAMALCGVVVGTRDSSLEELIEEDVSGYLVPKAAPDRLALALKKALALSHEEREHMAAAALERLKAYEPGPALANLLGFYEQKRKCRGDEFGFRSTRATQSAAMKRSAPAVPVSVVIATYCRGKPLARLLASLKAQTVPPGELIIVDASTDACTQHLIEELQPLTPCDLIYRKTERGLTFQRNVGLELAKCDFILFLDDDVVLAPDFIQRMWGAFEDDRQHSIGGVCGFIANQWGRPATWKLRVARLLGLLDGELRGGRLCRSGVFLELSMLKPFSGISDVDFLTGGATVYRREVFDEARPPWTFDGYAAGEDKYLSLRVRQKWRVCVCGDALLRHYPEPGPERPSAFRYGFTRARNHLRILKDVLGWSGWRSTWRVRLFYVYMACLEFPLALQGMLRHPRTSRTYLRSLVASLGMVWGALARV